VFGALYIIIPASAIIYLAGRSTDPYSLSRIACLVWASDIGAYIVGRWIGGPRINAKISPNKTWSGYYGGLLLTTLTGYFLSIPIPLAALISLLAQLGDLGESAIKRYFGITNSGNIIPGHGGIMDRFDSFVLVSVFLAISDFATRLIYG
jgi:phosphatidate cytidylyltransferase